jgi:hypothetical protein
MNQTKYNNDTVIEIIDLHPFELQLIKSLRTRFRFGDITITMKDGVPFQWKRITEIERVLLDTI